jgi:hypothetical protein
MRDSVVAQVTLVGSEPESQNHKLILLYIIQGIIAYLSPKTTRGRDGDSGYQLCPFIHLESENHMTLVYKCLVNQMGKQDRK